MQVSCSRDLHRRCALGFREDAIPRARLVGGARQVTCKHPALHEVQQEVDLHPVLQQVLSLGRSADTPDERAIRSRAAAGELSASGAGPTLIQKEWTCHGAPQSEARRTSNDNGVARSLKRMHRVRPVTGTWGTTRGLFSPVGSFTGDAPSKAQRGQPAGETIDSGWQLEEGQSRPVEERSSSQK